MDIVQFIRVVCFDEIARIPYLNTITCDVVYWIGMLCGKGIPYFPGIFNQKLPKSLSVFTIYCRQ